MTNLYTVISAHVESAASIKVRNQNELSKVLASLDNVKEIIDNAFANWHIGNTNEGFLNPADAAILTGRLYEIADALRESIEPKSPTRSGLYCIVL